VSIDPSLRVKSGLLKTRNVLTRDERIQRLAKARKWNEGDAVLGLPKVRTQWKQKGKKKEKKAEDKAAAPGAAGAATPAAGAPAAGAKPAAGSKPAPKK